MEKSPDPRAVDGFSAACRGPVLRPDDPGWDDARRVWNAMIDRRPALVVRCAGPADVARAVAFARDHGLPLAVRGGASDAYGPNHARPAEVKGRWDPTNLFRLNQNVRPAARSGGSSARATAPPRASR